MTDTTLEPLIIPHPVPLERMRGALSLGQSGRPLAVRLHDDDIAHMYEVAEHLGVSPSALMRWSIVYVARELQKRHFNKDIEVRA